MRRISTWGTNLREAREWAEWTQGHLGRLVSRDQRTVGRWENDIVRPRSAERKLLARLFGVGVDDLFPPCEPSVVAAARLVVGARTVTDLQSAVSVLQDELKAIDA